LTEDLAHTHGKVSGAPLVAEHEPDPDGGLREGRAAAGLAQLVV
jgi:hypothetical protein